MGSGNEEKTSILMLPWLAHGHVSPYFELAKKLTSLRNVHIYLCSTPVNLEPIRRNGEDLDSYSIDIVDFHLPASEELPPQFHTTNGLPPHLMAPLKEAFDMAKPEFDKILINYKPDILIYDVLQPWAPEAAKELGIKAVLFLTNGVSGSSFLTHYSEKPFSEYPIKAFNFDESEIERTTVHMNETVNGIVNKNRYKDCATRSCDIILAKSSREIEGEHIGIFSGFLGKEVVTVGCLLPQPNNQKPEEDETIIMNWLSGKDPCSVVFISFGSEFFLSKEEIHEIAHGLEKSDVCFIWVVRFPSGHRTTVGSVLPEGFIERTKGRGIVVEGWAPQMRILWHPNTGGFVSHCGWSSSLEALSAGVPVIAMPMQLDQPFNAKLLVEIGVAVEVGRENGRYESDALATALKKTIMITDDNHVRKKVKELSARLQDTGDTEIQVAADKLLRVRCLPFGHNCHICQPKSH